MSKRRISKQQSARIKKIQARYQSEDIVPSDFLADGLVITRFGKHVLIEDEQGSRISCTMRPNLDTLVAGDRIIWQAQGNKQGVVVSRYPRASMLARPDDRGIKKPVAANLTQIIIVVAPKPEISWTLLDSYLIMAETLKLHAVVVLNKTDLFCDAIQAYLTDDYSKLGYQIVFTNDKTSDGIVALEKLLNHQVSVFVGQSGVGKSSLISKILPHEKDITTGALTQHSELGAHTTSNSTYYHIPTGGALIDSPGVREFRLWDMDIPSLANGYVEFRLYSTKCKFRNCTHIDTPACAVLTAVNEGKIAKKRYDNFLKLCEQIKKY